MKRFFFTLVLIFTLSFAHSQEYLKIMSYNIRNANGMDRVTDYQRVANVIINNSPDIVAVQELDSATNRREGKFVLKEIAERTQMNYNYQPAISFDGGKYGIGILSKEEPLNVKGYNLPGREEQRAMIVAEFENYIFACVHLSLTEEDRMKSLEIIKGVAKGVKKPLYLAGDMNDEPGTPFINGLQEDFKILNDVKTATFPSNNPNITIDYIGVYKATEPNYALVKKEVIDEPMASDHRPVMVTLRLPIKSEKLFLTKPYLQNPADGGMTIIWETTIPAYSWVEYGTDSTKMERVRLLVDGQAEFNEMIHKIRLENLLPGNKYYYRVFSQEILHYGGYNKIFGNTAKSPLYTFETPNDDADSFTAIIFNDLHQREETFYALCKQIESIKYDFVVFNGDCIDDPKSREQVTAFIELLTNTVNGSSIPTIFIRGNHEIRDKYSIGLRKHLDYTGGKTYGAFNWGDTRIVMLDCGEDKNDNHREYSGLNDFTSLRLDQVDFLKEELKSKEFKRASKRVLIHHIPIYGMLGGNLCEPLWRPYLDKAPFDIAINGHMHKFAYYPAGTSQNRYPVVIGGGYSLSNATVMILKKEGKKLSIKVLDAKGDILCTTH